MAGTGAGIGPQSSHPFAAAQEPRMLLHVVPASVGGRSQHLSRAQALTGRQQPQQLQAWQQVPLLQRCCLLALLRLSGAAVALLAQAEAARVRRCPTGMPAWDGTCWLGLRGSYSKHLCQRHVALLQLILLNKWPLST